MIGQEILLEKIFSFSRETLPHSLMLIGEEGCGKHTLANEMSKHFKMPITDITEEISFEFILDAQMITSPTFFLINVSELTVKEQNAILKFLEEPNENVYLILISELDNVLATVKNRCVVFKFASYTIDELLTFVSEEDADLVKYCTTPGQILSTNSSTIKPLVNLCDNIITNIDKASYTNTLSIANKINFKDEFDKFDIKLFFNILVSRILDKYVETRKEFYLNLYNLTNEYYSKVVYLRTSVESIFTSYLSKIWRLSHNICQ